MTGAVSHGKLLWTTWVLTTLAALGPFVELVVAPHVRIAHRGAVLTFVLSVYAVFWYLLWVSGKIVCLVLAALIVLVAVKPSVPSRTKLATALGGILACCLLLYWISVVSHQW